MNDYQKAIKRGIETGLDNHFSKKESKKVWLTVEEAKGIYETIEEAKEFLWKYHKVPLTKLGQKDFDTLKKRIEQAEKGDA